MEPNKIDILLINILNGIATEEEIVFFSRWITETANERYFQETKEAWSLSEQISMEISVDEVRREQFINRIKKENNSKKLRRIVLASSSVAAMLIASFLILYNAPQQDKIDISEVKSIKMDKISNEITFITSTIDGDTLKVVAFNDSKKFTPSTTIGVADSFAKEKLEDVGVMSTIIVPKGKRLFVTLPDSSKMWLNSESRVHYPIAFAENSRTIEVTGNAYFDVVKDASRPFEVITGGIKTTALGTQFEVDNYDNQRCFVALVEGSVSVEDGRQKVIIEPNTKIESRFGVDEFIKSTFNSQQCGLWRDNILSINNETIVSIIEKLNRWHNVEIINRTKGVDGIFFTGKLDDGTIEEHLTIISRNIKLKFVKEGEKIIIWN